MCLQFSSNLEDVCRLFLQLFLFVCFPFLLLSSETPTAHTVVPQLADALFIFLPDFWSLRFIFLRRVHYPFTMPPQTHLGGHASPETTVPFPVICGGNGVCVRAPGILESRNITMYSACTKKRTAHQASCLWAPNSGVHF